VSWLPLRALLTEQIGGQIFVPRREVRSPEALLRNGVANFKVKKKFCGFREHPCIE
jgi:hypothetical protein